MCAPSTRKVHCIRSGLGISRYSILNYLDQIGGIINLKREGLDSSFYILKIYIPLGIQQSNFQYWCYMDRIFLDRSEWTDPNLILCIVVVNQAPKWTKQYNKSTIYIFCKEYSRSSI